MHQETRILQPKPIPQKLSKLVENIENGDYQIPKFQRAFVWEAKQVAKLIDSLIKGYPIGSFILWKTKERLNSYKQFGNSFLQEPKVNDYVYYILDGQQRITSLFLTYRGEHIKGSDGDIDFSQIFIDLDQNLNSDNEICSTIKTESSISFFDLMHKRGGEILKEYGEELFNKIDNIREQIRGYEFSTIEIEIQELERVVDIFTRINTSGKELTLFEIMNAKIYSNDFDLEEKFRIFIDDLRYCGYETIAENKSVVLQLISLVLKKSSKKSAILSIKKDMFIEEWEKSIEALKKAIDWTRESLKIPVSKLLPYYALLIPIAYFFRKNNLKSPIAKQTKQLQKLFFRSAFGGRYGSSSDTKLSEDIKIIEKILKQEEVNLDEIDVETSREKIKELVLMDFSTGYSFDKAVLCILAYQEPKKFSDNSKVCLDNSYLSKSSAKNYHHIFPKAFLKRIKQDSRANSLANISLIDDYQNKREIKDKKPSEYFSVFQSQNEELESALRTHLIGDMKEFGILDDNYELFLEKRSEWLVDEILKRIL